MRDIVIVGAARTPIGSFMGTLASVPAPHLGAVAIRAALNKANVSLDQVSEVVMGNVLAAGVGQAPARQAAIYAGIPNSVPALTVNKVCGSGMAAVIAGARNILLGDSEIVVAGGMENMSQTPFLLQGARGGLRMGNQNLVDSMIHDGLWDPYRNQHMGNCGDLCAREKNFTRKEQDDFAAESFRRAQETQRSGRFADEIAPVKIAGTKGEFLVESDEGPTKVQFEKIPSLKPAFDKNGTITAANASSINDGAAAVVLMTSEKAKQLGVTALARVVSYAGHAQDPLWFTTAPAEAMRKAAHKANWKLENIDVFEVNEAFAVVALAAQRELNIPHNKLNLYGGAIALGHPIGCSGTRILVTMLSVLKHRAQARGLAVICIGGGEALAVCLERI